MRLDAIVPVQLRADLYDVKRNPHPQIHPARRRTKVCLALLLAAGLPIASPAQQAEVEKAPPRQEAGEEPVRKVAVVDPKLFEAPSSPDDSLVLRNTNGQEVRAHLLSAHGDSVRIRRTEDSREFMVPISTFDDFTIERIRSWIDSDPHALTYTLSISATRNLVGSSQFTTAGKDYKTSDWSYRITISNLTRNDLTGAQVEYRIVYDDQVEFVRTAVSPGKGRNQQEGQAIDLPDMSFNDQIEFETPSLTLQTYKYEPPRAEREYARDTVKGIWIRVIKGGEIIGEYQSNPSSMASLSWDNQNQIDIQVTNRFRDRFGSGN